MFLLKKIIAPFFLPLPFCLFLSFVGLFLLWRGRMKTAGKVVLTVGLVLLTLFSYPPVSRMINAPLNGRYEAFPGRLTRRDSGKKESGICGGFGGRTQLPSFHSRSGEVVRGFPHPAA